MGDAGCGRSEVTVQKIKYEIEHDSSVTHWDDSQPCETGYLTTKINYKQMKGRLILFLAILLFTACAQKTETGNTPSDSTPNDTTAVFEPADIQEQVKYGRAVEAIVWSMPLVNFAAMYEAMTRDVKGEYNQIVYWSKPLNWKNQTLTPNTEAIYIMPFFNTEKAGPMVLEIPPAEGGSITGTIMDSWQFPLEDVGPAGVDKGKGGKYLILPPGYKEKIPAGYIVFPSRTYAGYALLRSILKSSGDADVAAAAAYARKIKLYPLSAADQPSETVFIDAYDQVFDATIPYDSHFFELLNSMVQAEPWIDRDKVMINTLKAIGIEKGKAFNPDEKTKQLFQSAAAETRSWLANYYETAYEPFFEGRHWFLPYDQDLVEANTDGYPNPNTYPMDSRAVLYYCAFSGVKHPGAGQFYLFDSRDKEGKPLDGGRNYKLSVPAKVPVRQYWSVTAYDFDTHALIRDVAVPDRSSLAPDLKTNADGSVDIYFGPTAPEGEESNWISTKAGGRFELIFRLYGPEKEFFDKTTWVLPDVEEVK